MLRQLVQLAWCTIFIKGATGDWSGLVNGGFYVTGEKRFCHDVYGKVGDDHMCIEHFGGKWQLKPLSNKGENRNAAEVTGGCALEACTSRLWSVSDGKTHVPQPSVKMLCGADAEREVSHAPSVTARRACVCDALTNGVCAGCS